MSERSRCLFDDAISGARIQNCVLTAILASFCFVLKSTKLFMYIIDFIPCGRCVVFGSPPSLDKFSILFDLPPRAVYCLPLENTRKHNTAHRET